MAAGTAVAPAPNGRRPDLGIVGTTGLRRSGGVVLEELLPELRGQGWHRALRQMIDQDSDVGAILHAIRMFLRQIDWRVDPATEDTQGEADRLFLEQCLFEDMSIGWADTLGDILSFLAWGFAPVEIVWKYRRGQTNDPRTRSHFDDGRVGVRKLMVLAQDSLLEWLFDPEGGIQGFVQQAYETPWRREIPIEKMLLFRTSIERGNPEGRSLLRNAYLDWYHKKHLTAIESVGIERDATGYPMLYVPAEVIRQATPEAASIYAHCQATVTGIRRDEREGGILPSDRDEHGQLRYELKLVSAGGNRQLNVDTAITRHRAAIHGSVMTDFLLLGHEKVGSFALAKSKTDAFVISLGAWADTIADVVNQHLVPRLWRYNGWAGRPHPQLAHGDADTIDLEAVGLFLTNLAKAGAPIDWPSLLPPLMEAAKLPPPPEDDGTTETEEEAAA